MLRNAVAESGLTQKQVANFAFPTANTDTAEPKFSRVLAGHEDMKISEMQRILHYCRANPPRSVLRIEDMLADIGARLDELTARINNKDFDNGRAVA